MNWNWKEWLKATVIRTSEPEPEPEPDPDGDAE